MAAAPERPNSKASPAVPRELSQTQPLNADAEVVARSGKESENKGGADRINQEAAIAGDGIDGDRNDPDKDVVGFEGDEWEEGEVERGMLHALVELGHLEMLLHQVRAEGVSTRAGGGGGWGKEVRGLFSKCLEYAGTLNTSTASSKQMMMTPELATRAYLMVLRGKEGRKGGGGGGGRVEMAAYWHVHTYIRT